MKKIVFVSLIPIYGLILCMLIITAVTGSYAVTTISENAPIKGRQCVIIDAGHGGVDGGATSCTGVLESNINLQIAQRLEDVMHLLGSKTVMIRTTDCSVYTEGESIAAKKVSDLKQRVKIANETDNAFLISIHQNYFSDQRYSGAQVFYPRTTGSDAFARNLQESFIKTLNPGSKRQAKKADGVYLLNNIRCPGVLVECGFLSNPQEEANLRSKDYQLQICCVIASTYSKYLYNIVA